MVNYSNGKIYKIIDFSNDNFYVGSTTQERLCSRLAEHVGDLKCYMRGTKYKYCASMEIIINENYKIFLLETYPCNSKDELNMKEQEHMDKLRCDKMVNKRNAYVSKEDLLIKIAKFRKDNPDFVRNRDKGYYHKHKDKKNARKREKVECPNCKKMTNRSSIARHMKTQRCLDFVEKMT
mgnify:FL=1|jgi:hypothetical protein